MDQCIERDRKYYAEHKQQHNARSKAYYEQNRDAIRAQRKAYRLANADVHKQQQKAQRDKPHAKISSALRKRTRTALKTGKSYLDLLGCSTTFLLKYFSFMFSKLDPAMTVDNHGSYWEIDHVRPVASFDMNDESQRKACFHWSNLSPLERIKNKRKNKKIDVEAIQAHDKLVEEFNAWCKANDVVDEALDTAAASDGSAAAGVTTCGW